MKKLRVGFVGYGRRGPGMLRTIAKMPDIEVVIVCDVHKDRQESAAAAVKEFAGNTPLQTGNYKDLLHMNLDAVVNCASWADHVNIVVDCLNAGVPIGFEVGGAYNVDDCWEIVKTYERTGTPCMMLTNTKFNRQYMAVSKMVREGLFGKVVHCDGGYCHYMANNVFEEHYTNGYYRFINYLLRCSENYPCHVMGTFADILGLNRGNKIVTLSSVASASHGIHDYIMKTHGPEHPMADERFAQGDIISTTLKCVKGETISLRLDTTLPRPYSRRFEIRSTEGMYQEDTNSLYLNKYPETCVEDIKELFGNADKYLDNFLHPSWANTEEINVGGISMAMDTGHGGTDFRVCRAFFDSLRNNWPMITDVYDAALFMSLTPLSEESIAKGGAPVMVPDFTRGRYLTRKVLTQDDNFWSI